MRFRILLLALAVAVIPACKANKALAAPVLIDGTPTSSSAPIMPNIIMEFDRPMDAADMSNKVNFGVFPGTATTSIGITVQYLPALNQVRIIPDALLSLDTKYTVLVAGAVKSAAGTPLGQTNGFTFTTAKTTTTTSLVSWGGATGVTGANNPGDIDLTIATAQEGSPLADISATYNVYYSLNDGEENLLMSPLPTSPVVSGARTINLPQAATVYHLKIQAVDSSGSVCNAISEFTVTTK